MIYPFIAVDAFFIIIIIIFLNKIKSGKLTSSFINPLIVIFAILLFLLPFLPQPRFFPPRPIRISVVLLSIFLEASALYLFIGAICVYKKYSIPLTPRVWTPPKLVRKGVFSIVRHPIYLSELLAYGGFFLYMRGLYALCIIYPMLVIATYIRAYAEERYILTKNFPEEYGKYRKKVGMFIPKFWR